MSLEMWAVAAVAVVDAAGRPLVLRTFTSPPQVLNSPEAPQQAHLYVGPEDIIKIHFLLFSSLDRCEEVWQASKQRLQTAAAAKQASAARSTSASTAGAEGTRPPSSVVVTTTTTNKQLQQQQQQQRTTSHSSGSPGAAPQTKTGAPLSASAVPASSTIATGTATAAAAVATAAPPPPRLVTSTTDVRFTGKLIQSHRFLSYGFCSATGIKTLLVTVGNEAPQDAVLPLCRAIYEAASSALCNPFRTPSLCRHAQQALLAKSYQEIMNYRQFGREVPAEEKGDVAKGESSTVFSPGTLSSSDAKVQQELRWPIDSAANAGVPPSAGQQPTLALSATFDNQLKSILSTFTVTSQSCIMR